MGIVDAKDKEVSFYAVMHFYYSIYDGAADKEKVKVEFGDKVSFHWHLIEASKSVIRRRASSLGAFCGSRRRIEALSIYGA